jgi:hypothetical protein
MGLPCTIRCNEISDCDLDRTGEPDFLALLRGKTPVCVYAFDLLAP